MDRSCSCLDPTDDAGIEGMFTHDGDCLYVGDEAPGIERADACAEGEYRELAHVQQSISTK